MSLSNLIRGSDRTADFEGATFKKRADFFFGTTLTANDQVLLWSADRSGDGNYYLWNGAYPKIVPPGATPATSGGVSATAWVKISPARRYQRSVDVRQFGAKGDGLTDDTAAVQAAINYVLTQTQPVLLTASAGTYLIGNVIIDGQVHIQGEGIRDSGTIFRVTGNNPGFRVRSGCRFDNFAVKGTMEAAKTSQVLILIDSSVSAFNSPLFRNLHLQGGYDSVRQSGANPVFYCDFDHITWTDCINSFLWVNNGSSPGFDFIMNDCRMLGGATNYAMNFDNGLGSGLISNLQCSIVGTHPSQAVLNLGVPASGFGGLQIDNSVLEGGQTRILGLPLNPWKELKITNTLLTGLTQVAMSIGHCSGLIAQGCTFSSSNAGQIVSMLAGVTSAGIIFDNPSFEGTGAAPCIKSLGATVINMTVKTPKWTGGSAVIDFSNVPSTQLSLTANGGGTWGGSANSILLADAKNTSGEFSAFGFEYGPLRRATFVGLTSGTGTATIPHGIDQGHLKIVNVFGVTKGGSGQAVPLNSANFTFDGLNIYITGVGTNTQYRVGVLWNTVPDTNWG